MGDLLGPKQNDRYKEVVDKFLMNAALPKHKNWANNHNLGHNCINKQAS